MHKYLTEAIGAFFWLLAVGMSVLTPGAGSAAPVAIGLTVMVVSYAGLHSSGAHYNPAVSLACALAAKLRWRHAWAYVGAQVLGALLAVPIILYYKRAPIPLPELAFNKIFLVELLFSFALIYSVLALRAAGKHMLPFLPLAVGGLLIAGAYAVGGVSAATFNPAVAVALYALGLLPAAILPAYLSAQLVAALLAWLVYRYCLGGSE